MRKSLVLTCLLAACTVGAPQKPWYERTWEWSLDRPPTTLDSHVYVLDPIATDGSTVDALHHKKRRAVCYVNPSDTTGMIEDRVRLCHDKDFDGVALAGKPSAELSAYSEKLGLMVFCAETVTLPPVRCPASLS